MSEDNTNTNQKAEVSSDAAETKGYLDSNAAEDKVTVFTNDFTNEDKIAIKKAVSEKIDVLLNTAELTINDLSHLAQVAHGSIKSRAKQTQSAREIVVGVLKGTRASRTPAVNAESVKSFIGSLPEEEKQKMLDELLAKA